jgi:hypothetical protein
MPGKLLGGDTDHLFSFRAVPTPKRMLTGKSLGDDGL